MARPRPDGQPRVAQLLLGVGANVDDCWLDHLLAVTDRALPRLQAVRVSAGQTVLLSDPWEATLLDRFRECRAQGLPGVPRAELLDHLRHAAQALATLQRGHHIQHLNLSPANLLLRPQGLQLEGFGLAQLLWLPVRVPLAHLHIDYAARELHDGRLSPHCDQYSLALIFAEMLLGEHPVRGAARGCGCCASRGRRGWTPWPAPTAPSSPGRSTRIRSAASPAPRN